MVIFGHALYEGLVLGRGAMTGCGVRVRTETLPSRREQVQLADAALVALVEGDGLEPSRLARVPLAAGYVSH
jgi:hypothetical protein